MSDIHDLVRERYGRIAKEGGTGPGCCAPQSACCGDAAEKSRRMGYAEAELAAAPEGANLGLGCGNPQAIAALRAGEVVVDLGSGAGFDAFLAARQVEPEGKVIGIDMTPEMLDKARANARKVGAANVSFLLGRIEDLPLPEGVADVVISNCVINLSPDKPRVFAEAFRVLKPGGRVAVSDVVRIGAMPAAMAADPEGLCACISGAATPAEIEDWLAAAGFTEAAVSLKPESREMIAGWAPGSGAEDFVVSAFIAARKPVA